MRRSAQQLISLPGGPGHIYLKIYHKLRALILDGSWPAGTRLPSSRRLAKDLGVSRNTAILAIDQLMADGWINTRAGSGVFVSAEAPAASRPNVSPLIPQYLDHSVSEPQPFQITPAALDIFPIDRWARIQSRIWRTASTGALNEGSGAGWYPLRCAVAAHLYAVRGLPCTPEQVVIVPSSQAAVDILLRVMAAPGDGVWMEEPGYPLVRQALRAHGLVEHSIEVDSSGMRVEDGVERAPHAKLAYVMPACQFPTCSVMSTDRRRRLLAWARSSGGYVIEDDWDFNAGFQTGHPPEPLAAADREHVLYVHSFNRLLFPALGIAALVVPEPLVARIVEHRRTIDAFTNVANQIALAEFIQSGLLAAHLRACRAAYAERRDALQRAILAHMPPSVSFDPDQAGLHLVGYLDGHSDAQLAARARRAGFACSALCDYRASSPPDAAQALLLGFAAFAPELLEPATQALAGALFSHRAFG
jgi:GntR family transcriptional regulator/MocR family aminotransferase